LRKIFCVDAARIRRYVPRVKFQSIFISAFLVGFAILAYGQDQPSASAEASLVAPETAARTAEELRVEEQQRILGVVPEFNISNLHDAAPLSTQQKFQLAMKSALDPFSFAAAGLDAGLGQWQKQSPGYGYGMQGYARRFQAAYIDAFDGAILGNAVFPSLLHQDPRYFRQGTGSFGSRLMHAISSTYRSKNDNGKWTWNYSNILGNIAAGGIANAYYAPSDRGAALTFERAFTVTAEGALGAVFYEFWPDISRKLVSHRKKIQS